MRTRAEFLFALLLMLPVVARGQVENADPTDRLNLIQERHAGAAEAHGQSLADRVPADAVLYVSWRGSDALGSAYQDSRLKAVLADSQIPALLDQFLPQVMEKAGSLNPQAAKVGQLVSDLGKPLWHYRSAFFFAGLVEGEQSPVPRLAIISQAGADAEELRKKVSELLEQQGAPPFPIHVAKVGDLVVVTVGYEKAEDALVTASGETQPLAKDPIFVKALAHVDAEAAFMVYVSGPRLLKLIENLPDADPQFKENWPKVRDALGIKGLESIILSSGFDGKDWGSRVFVGAPAPRSGALAMMGGAPLPDETLRTIPVTATVAGAGFFNASALLKGIRSLASQADPDAANQFDSILQQANQAVGIDIQKDLLDSLGTGWAYYCDPATTGKGLLGLVVVNPLKDPAKAEDAITKLEQFANKAIAANMPRQPGQPRVSIEMRQTRVGDLNIHYLGFPLLSPAWAVAKGNLYLALYPQNVAVAAGHDATRDKSILDNPSFIAMRQRLGYEKPDSFQFVDLPRTAPDAYTSWLAISHLSGLGDLFGIPAPPMLLPTLPKLLAQLTPAGSVSWTDADGLHARSIEPFPASGVFTSDPQSLASVQAPLMISILLPALNRAREQANRVKSASNLRQIGTGAMMYANDHNGKFPVSLGEIAATEDLTIDVFVNPRGSHSAPHGLPPEQVRQWIDQNSDYIWLGQGRKVAGFRSPSDEVLAYENPQGLSDGINILYADGHVDFNLMAMAQQKIPNLGQAAPRRTPRQSLPKNGGL